MIAHQGLSHCIMTVPNRQTVGREQGQNDLGRRVGDDAKGRAVGCPQASEEFPRELPNSGACTEAIKNYRFGAGNTTRHYRYSPISFAIICDDLQMGC